MIFKIYIFFKEQFDNLNLSSNQPIEHQNNGKIFDDQCITDLSKILDRDDQWQILTLLFEFEGMVSTWKLLPSPSVAFLYYLEVSFLKLLLLP